MGLSEKDVQHVAALAHLELTKDEVSRFLPQLDSILQYVQKLNELDTTDVAPMAQVTHAAGDNPALRVDQESPTFASDVALENAPDRGPGYFKVPSVIEGD